MSIAFIGQTIPISMRNIPTCMHKSVNKQRTTSPYQNRPRYYVKSLTAQNACFGQYQAPLAACTTLMFMHSIPSCTAQYIIMHWQHVLYQHMPTCLHNVPVYLQNVNMRYALCNMLSCMHNMHCATFKCETQHAQPKDQSSWSSPKGISLYHRLLEKTLKLLRWQACFHNVLRTTPKLPQGDWGTLHQISRCYTHWLFPRTVHRSRPGNVTLIVVSL